MDVGYAFLVQRVLQGIRVELRVVPGARDRPDICDARHSVRLEEMDELVNGSRRVANGQHNWRNRGRLLLFLCLAPLGPGHILNAKLK